MDRRRYVYRFGCYVSYMMYRRYIHPKAYTKPYQCKKLDGKWIRRIRKRRVR